jgi:tripartite-type tricarboxylate transporter receptor subunit TctC
VNQALKSDEAKTSYAAQGFDLLGGGPQEFARAIASDTARWTIAAQAAGLKK